MNAGVHVWPFPPCALMAVLTQWWQGSDCCDRSDRWSDSLKDTTHCYLVCGKHCPQLRPKDRISHVSYVLFAKMYVWISPCYMAINWAMWSLKFMCICLIGDCKRAVKISTHRIHMRSWLLKGMGAGTHWFIARYAQTTPTGNCMQVSRKASWVRGAALQKPQLYPWIG